MSGRPKRKATNRAYNDTIDESIFEEQPQISKSASGSIKKRSKKKENSNTSSKIGTPASENSQDLKAANDNIPNGISAGGSSTSIPYNWQPMPEPVDYFSHKLNLKAAFVDVTTQTLSCPNQPLIPQTYNDSFQPVNTNNKRRKYVANKEMFTIKKHDFIYMVSEPPGEPYYIGSVMGFTKKEGSSTKYQDSIKDTTNSNKNSGATTGNNYEDAANYVFKIQWYYRPRDISKSTSDSRLLYASMHTDTCPLSSFRGLATVKHKQDIETGLVPVRTRNENGTGANSNGNGNSSSSSSSSSPSPTTPLELYSQQPNCFYFDKLFDRYMVKFYDIISTKSLLIESKNNDKNQNFLKALNKRFEFIFVEGTIAKAFINSFSLSSCNCEKCGQWCSNQDSVNCVVCNNHYHMHCLDPPLLKKPSRGFSWSCALCTKKHEMEHQRKKMIMLSHDNKSSNEMQLTNELSYISSPVSEAEDQDQEGEGDGIEEEEEEELDGFANSSSLVDGLPKFESMAKEFLKLDSNLSLEQRRIKEEWNMRYLGMHARLEDGVDIEDRSPYPRASTRLGARHQAINIPEYEDHPIIYYDNEKTLSVANGNSKRKVSKKARKNNNYSDVNEAEEDPAFIKLEVPKEFEDLPASDYPDWLQPRPKGYLERGEDDGEGRTCTLLYKPAVEDIDDNFQKLDRYVEMCYPIAEKKLRIIPTTPNFMDAILKTYMESRGNVEGSLKIVNSFTRDSLAEPTLTKEEIKKFEDGVRKYGSELYPTFKEVKSQSCAMIVRYYYLWKKTANGRKNWGNFEGRIQKKLQNIKEEEKVSKPATEIDFLASTEDDSSYENDRIQKAKNIMTCKHCSTHQSILWYRITGHDANPKSGSSNDKTLGLCFRCARIWRRYAVVWEDPQEVKKKNTRGAGGWKKKVEYELVRDAEKLFRESQKLGGGFNYNVAIPETSVLTPPVLPGSTTSSRKSSKPSNSTKKSVTSTTKGDEPPKKKRSIAKKNDTSKTTSALASTELKLETEPKSLEATSASAPPLKLKAKKASAPKVSAIEKKTVKSNSKNANLASNKKEVIAKASSKSVSSSSASANNLNKQFKAQDSTNSNGKRKRNAEPIKKAIKKRKDSDDKEAPEELQVPVPKIEKAVAKKAKKAKPTIPNLSESNNGSSDNTSAVVTNVHLLSKDASNDVLLANSNKNYVMIKFNKKGEKKLTMTRDILKNTIDQFRPRQLLEVGAQLPAYQIPAGTVVDLPFSVKERNCSVCQEVDAREESVLETLICSNCGVNVHASCVGASISSSIVKPVKEWLCEPCVNDLNPQFSTLYSCSLCLANESNYELTMLGSNKVRPDFLKPISDSGKWCHLLCALFNFECISFKTSPKRERAKVDNFPKIDASTGRISNSCSIESASEVYLKGYDTKCGICRSGNGSLIECDLCESKAGSVGDGSAVKYHPTCVQDASKFSIGFKISVEKTHINVDKEIRLVKIGELVGRLKPVISCPKHHDLKNTNFFNFRDIGKRVNTGEEKPVIHLFIEDILKAIDPSSKLTGPQAKANNYIKLTTMFERSEKKREERTYFRVLKQHEGSNKNHIAKVCKKCKVKVSPMWWPIGTSTVVNGDSHDDSSFSTSNGSVNGVGDTIVSADIPKIDQFYCQVCYHDEQESEEDEAKEGSKSPPATQSQSLLEMLSEPLTAEKFGLKSNTDKLPISSFGRSAISLGDILT
ncbi:hypothetical protein CLIB1423_01S04720 [[Candida] railenensis]|uniref:Uncharacterized protein n=1 Tax=[Candida] railenensis TaxID=45579 RepID=A0A9P0QKF4_9ASCO|nr:hypothetical protein CLIB1423_01S04720 [[Candida] railenensis]